MATETYSLEQFVADLDRITGRESAPAAITAQVAPLLGRLVQNPAALPARFRGRAPAGGRGRFMLHRAPRFNVTAVVGAPGIARPPTTTTPGARSASSTTRSRRPAIAWLPPRTAEPRSRSGA